MGSFFNLGPGMLSLGAAFLITVVPALIVLGIPALWNALGSVAGTYLRRKTEGRRSKILEVIEEDEKQYAEKQEKRSQDSRSDEDGGWEKVQAYSASSAADGSKQAEDWSGIVGFFHPFWYVYSNPISSRNGRLTG